MVSGHWCHCNDVACCLNPLLGKGIEWRVWWDHPLNGLHDCLESHGIEVWIQIPYNIAAGGPCVGHFRSSDGWVLAGVVLRISLG
jgi:hypothetical protein